MILLVRDLHISRDMQCVDLFSGQFSVLLSDLAHATWRDEVTFPAAVRFGFFFFARANPMPAGWGSCCKKRALAFPWFGDW